MKKADEIWTWLTIAAISFSVGLFSTKYAMTPEPQTIDINAELCRYSVYANDDYVLSTKGVLYCRSAADAFQKLRLPELKEYNLPNPSDFLVKKDE